MILSIDLGTSSVKGAIFLESRLLRSLGRVIYKRQDASSWIVAIQELISSLAHAERADLAQIVISGQGPTIVPILRNQQILKPSFYYAKGAYYPAKQANIASYFLPKVAYLLRKKPRLSEQVHYFVNAPDFIAYWLTGEVVTSLPNHAYRELIWSPEEIQAYGFSPDWFPPYAQDTAIGTVRQALRQAWMLPRRVVVYTTTFDFLSALLGSQSTQVGDVLNRAGMSEGINFITNQIPDTSLLPTVDSFWRITPHVLPHLYNVGVVFNEVGQLMQQHNYDLDEVEIQLHVAKITRIWNEMQPINVKQIRLCGGQTYHQDLNAMKRRLSHHPLHVLRFNQPELTGNAMYGAWLSGYYATLEESVDAIGKEVN
ncbi:FGGY family carbohydrate kinase [Entomospira culicis]|uniref:Carbohydrate kinase FGGY N-terminal domain-containing protein n=1 Tax=Entomospira culicis TaxID=2719989 RepID=A0A968GLI1_9SPIO|nr:FGGY family carbohydrate kinase [Entomospira culicis]NIZ19786.1 hypothetical protein [Entomospira culicis]NIZ70000.1 hypothetical protein [Entomospira culicis]WDI37105.1 hypothetical protein PVA46_07230 [Entomospira culicis]WDI38734.1 hypothetical protein PVA47_07240 [Entomospira culicis]